MKFIFAAAFIGAASFLLYSTWQPPVDVHSFRQSQTGLTAFWLKSENRSGDLLSYETPVFGYPWMVPFEFPLYQVATAVLSDLTGKSISRCGRLVSAGFWLLTFLPLYLLCRDLGFGARYFALSSVLLLCSPLYLYWSRAILMESTAVFFGFAFLWFVVRGIAKNSWYWWPLASLAGTVCALVKVTTFPSFGFAAAGCVLLLKCSALGERRFADFGKPLVYLIAIGLGAMAVVALWTHHADAIKETNIMAAQLISARLSGWNFGTWEQRVSPETWRVLLSERSIPLLLGAPWVLGLFVGAIGFCERRVLCTVLFLVGLFFLPLLVFTNLHFIHDYYQYAAGFWLVLAFALAFSQWFQMVPRCIGYAALAAVLTSQLVAFQKVYFPRTQVADSPAKAVGEFVRQETSPKEVVIVLGDGWSPEVAFFSERRCIYLLNWLDEATTGRVLESLATDHPYQLLGSKRTGAVVVNDAGIEKCYDTKNKSVIKPYIEKMPVAPVKNVGPYRVYSGALTPSASVAPASATKSDADKQSAKPSVDLAKTKSLFDKITMQQAGAGPGKIEWRDGAGILIHPGSTPTEAVFDVSGMPGATDLAFWIVGPPEQHIDNPMAGTAAVEVFLDGVSQGRKKVDRRTNESLAANLTGVSEMRVVVDDADGTQLCDWFFLGVN